MAFRSLIRTSDLRSKVLMLGKTQINLVFPSLNRTFALNIQHSNTMNTEERYISLLDKNTHRVFNDKMTFEEAEIAKFNAEDRREYEATGLTAEEIQSLT